MSPMDNSPGDTWMHEEAPIFIGRAKQAEGVGCIVQSWGEYVDAQGAFDLTPTGEIKRERGSHRGPRFHQFRAIGRC